MPKLDLYQAQVRIGRKVVLTAVFAESSGEARDLLEAAYGNEAVVTRPDKID